MGIHLDDYHESVTSYLAEQLPFLNSVTEYPESPKRLKTPCAFFGILDWDRTDSQRMNGELTLSLNCQLLIVFDLDLNGSHKNIRNAAMLASLKIDGARFGLDVEPAMLISAKPWSFEHELRQYEVWAVDFKHEVDIGTDEYAAMPDFLPSQVMVGVTESGEDVADEYEQVNADE